MNPNRCLKWISALWLLCMPCMAMAEWEKVDENYLAVVYIDPDKIRASSVFPQAWHLIDLNDKSKAGVKSRLVLMEYDCHERRRRTLAFASKSEAMGEGKTLFTSTQSTPWKPVSGDTVAEKVIEMFMEHLYINLMHGASFTKSKARSLKTNTKIFLKWQPQLLKLRCTDTSEKK